MLDASGKNESATLKPDYKILKADKKFWLID